MTYINRFCADAGTANCPCPLAETGDCLVCSRLAGKGACDCRWAGVCIYNEYIQNDSRIRTKRENIKVPILGKTCYEDDVMVMQLGVPRGFALEASSPGAFVFISAKGQPGFSNVPVSVMKADAEKNSVYIVLKIISGKTKTIAAAEDYLYVRGVYKNGLLGKGLAAMLEDVKKNVSRWLVITKGVGFAPAVNLLKWAGQKVRIDIAVDTEKVSRQVVWDCMQDFVHVKGSTLNMKSVSLAEVLQTDDAHFDCFGDGASRGRDSGDENFRETELAVRANLMAGYDRVIILASDYYIKKLTEQLEIPAEKLVFSNNFRMCCGEGICGACGHADECGIYSKMCKCRELDAKDLM